MNQSLLFPPSCHQWCWMLGLCLCLLGGGCSSIPSAVFSLSIIHQVLYFGLLKPGHEPIQHSLYCSLPATTSGAGCWVCAWKGAQFPHLHPCPSFTKFSIFACFKHTTSLVHLPTRMMDHTHTALSLSE